MRRHSDSPPQYHSPPPRRERDHGDGGGGRGRSPPPRRGGHERRKEEPNHGSLLVRNIPLDSRPEELRAQFERFGVVRDVYLPKNYYTGEPRGFAFVEFVDSDEASEAQYRMNGKTFAGREISVVVAAQTRKRPEVMRQRTRSNRGPGPSYGERRSSRYGRSRSRSVSRSRSPHHTSGSRSRRRSRSNSPDLKRRDHDYSASPSRSHRNYPRSPRGPPRERDGEHGRRSYSPGAYNASEKNTNDDGSNSSDLKLRDHDYSASLSRSHRNHPRSPRGPPRERDGEHSYRSYSPGAYNASEKNTNDDGKPGSEDAKRDRRTPERTPTSPP